MKGYVYLDLCCHGGDYVAACRIEYSVSSSRAADCLARWARLASEHATSDLLVSGAL